MKLYADDRDRLLRQVVFDTVTALWVVGWLLLARRVHTTVVSAQGGSRRLESGATDMSGRMTQAGDSLSRVPLVGGSLRQPFTDAADAAAQVSLAGHDLTIGIGRLATLLAWLVASAPIALALLVWAYVRLRYARDAGRAGRLLATPGGRDVLALQALATASPAVLARVDDEPAAAWRSGDDAVIRRLAAVRIRSLGLRAPREQGVPAGAHAPDGPGRPGRRD